MNLLNKSGHDAIFEAELNEKENIVAWLLAHGEEDFAERRNMMETTEIAEVGDVAAESSGQETNSSSQTEDRAANEASIDEPNISSLRLDVDEKS